MRTAISANGKAEYRATEVENPYFSTDHPEDVTNPRHITVSINLKESAIVSLKVKGRLDPHQLQAAERFRILFELSEGMRSPKAEVRASMSDRSGHVLKVVNAGKELERCRSVLGWRGYGLVKAVCGEGKGLSELFEGKPKRDKLTAADNLRACLDDLAQMWGFMVPEPTTP